MLGACPSLLCWVVLRLRTANLRLGMHSPTTRLPLPLPPSQDLRMLALFMHLHACRMLVIMAPITIVDRKHPSRDDHRLRRVTTGEALLGLRRRVSMVALPKCSGIARLKLISRGHHR